MQTLTVVNQMLGTMGEVPISTLEDPHTYRGACLQTLDTENRNIQARGWWFNMEDITLSPQLSGRISLPGDIISVRTASREIAQRGRYLYRLDQGSYTFEAPVKVTLIRLVPFEELPETAAAYIAACAVVKFQSKYDGDTAKTRLLKEDEAVAYAAAHTEHIRNRRTNLIQSNDKLLYLKSLTNGARRFIR